MNAHSAAGCEHSRARLFGSTQTTTDSPGDAIVFEIKGVSAGCYTVDVTAIDAGGLVFDGITPANEWCR